MPLSLLMTALFIISILTSLTVEGIKKMLEGTNIKYSSNILAAICSVLISVGGSILYIILHKMLFNEIVIVEIAILTYLGFLTSTVGYDKVIQTIKQFQGIKEVPRE